MDMWPNDGSSSSDICWISYEDIINDNELTSHTKFEAWRRRLFQYLRQEQLEHVVTAPPFVPLGLNLQLEERTRWIERMLDEAKVKSILLHTIPLENFKANKDKSAYEIFQTVARECVVSAKREVEASNRGKKRKQGEDGGPSTGV